MLIINADDFGRSQLATDRILACFKQGSVTSVSAMVFMEDSPRAAELAMTNRIDSGLHLNFTQELTHGIGNELFCEYHTRIVRFLIGNKYNFLVYNPSLRKQFQYVFKIQIDEFERLYGMSPSHIDGHHHMHLCANMLFESIIPEGQKIRRNFTFMRGEKGMLNRLYRASIDKWLAGRYLITDYLFSLSDCIKKGQLQTALNLTKISNVELQTHPEREHEYKWLIGPECAQVILNQPMGTYTQLPFSSYLGKKPKIRIS